MLFMQWPPVIFIAGNLDEPTWLSNKGTSWETSLIPIRLKNNGSFGIRAQRVPAAMTSRTGNIRCLCNAFEKWHMSSRRWWVVWVSRCVKWRWPDAWWLPGEILFQTNEWKIWNQNSANVWVFFCNNFWFCCGKCWRVFFAVVFHFPLVVVLCVVRYLESKWPTFWQRKNRSR